MADFLGLAQQQDQANKPTTTDIFGVRSPLSLAGQPALPQGGPAAAGTSSAPPTVAGTGVAPTAPQGPGAPGFGELAAGAMPEVGGGASGTPGPGEGPGISSGVAGALGQPPGNFGFNVGVPGIPASVGIGPSGTVGAGVSTGNPTVDSIINGALSFAFGSLGIPTSVNVPSLIATLTSSPFLGVLATSAGAVGLPLTMATLAHSISKGVPGSTTNLLSNFQQAINDPEPNIAETAVNAQNEAQAAAAAAAAGQSFTFSSPQAAAIASAMGVPGISAFGGGYAIGQNTGAALGQSPNLNTPEAQAQNLSQTPAFASLAQSIFGTGRTDTGPVGPPAEAPPGQPGVDPSGEGANAPDGSTSDGGAAAP